MHVGRQLKRRREALGVSQTELGRALGVTFQQIQKYENGTNRLSAATLWRAAERLDVPITYFFDGLTDRAPPPWAGLPSRDERLLLTAASKMPEGTRKALVGLVTVWMEGR